MTQFAPIAVAPGRMRGPVASCGARASMHGLHA
jgi:hypothetical protein